MLGKCVRQAIDNWTPYLLEQTKNPGNYQYNMFMMDIVSISDKSVGAERLNWHLLRTFESMIVFSKKEVGIYCKIPGFLFFSHINPNTDSQWKGTKVGRKGAILSPQHMRDKRFGTFLLNRIKMANVMLDTRMSHKQWGKIADSYINNFDAVKHKNLLDIIRADTEIERQLSDDDCS